MNAWPPQASYPCGNFSDTSFFKLRNKEDRKADISALRPFTEGRSQGGSPPETTTTTTTTTTQTTTTSEHNEILTSSSTTTATATITTTGTLTKRKKYGKTMGNPSANAFEKSTLKKLFYWPGLCSEKKVVKKIL